GSGKTRAKARAWTSWRRQRPSGTFRTMSGTSERSFGGRNMSSRASRPFRRSACTFVAGMPPMLTGQWRLRSPLDAGRGICRMVPSPLVQPAHYSVKSFYLLPQWTALMERWTGARAHRFELNGEHGGRFSAVVYRKSRGVVQPRFMPYIGCEFTPTRSDHTHKITLQWLDVADQFVSQLRDLRWQRWLTLPPEL